MRFFFLNIKDKFRKERSRINFHFCLEIFVTDASVFENRTASVVFLTRGSEAQKITQHMAQKSKKKLDVISEAFLRNMLDKVKDFTSLRNFREF